ncbi:activating signal cointegrator 1 complex subunit 1 protein [Purpureocillium lavendulum]|uniref:Activating signal cointegrator 1 complex subunit 1 protein n=1 Tax=Purpureocillium lavendulum TaxID=1247861 RepID=A0AB34FNN8_9HYPO|nr:activating signal cointegrator 1 complex subunit 1 protein [Purpureocillium lavendulum]
MPPRPAPTHFVCIPLASPQLARNWAAFRADVTSPTSFAWPEDSVRPLGTLHLTLGVMSLKPDGVDQAAEVLRSLRPRELLAELRAAKTTSPLSFPPGGEPTASPAAADGGEGSEGGEGGGGIAVTLRGLQAMQAPTKTSVLYAPPTDDEGLLYPFCERLRAPFREAGLMADEGRPMLLHATVVNTIHVKGGARGGRRSRERLLLDAREVLGRYDDFEWVQGLPLTRVAVCRMGAKPVEGTDDQAYEAEAEIEV